ncbi:MAG: amidase, partial [Betaproteobacteria bacterium]|nr:amidase [Betaproteobacteria bacterium]
AGAEPPAPRKPGKLIRLHTRGWKELDAETIAQFESAIEALQRAGVKIAGRDNDSTVARFEDEIERGVDGALAIVACEMKWPYEDYVARYGKVIGERIHKLLGEARKTTPSEYERLLANRRRVRELAREVLAGADGFITLASSGPAVQGLEYTGNRTFLVCGSWLGLPAFSLPLLAVNGLPQGIQLMGAPDADGALCAAANWFMKNLD